MRYWRVARIAAAQARQAQSAEWMVLRPKSKRFTASVSTISRGCSSISKSVTGTSRATSYDSKLLTELERKNLQTIATRRRNNARLAISPGDMEFFENKPITEQMLQGIESARAASAAK